MELSAILPLQGMGGEASSLNDDFAAQTPSGDNIFNKPVADSTVFDTEFGSVTASFLFDPSQEFGNRHILASITTDFMSELRDALTAHLLDPKDIAPKKKSYEETLWDNIVSNVPKENLAKNVFNDAKKLKQYMDVISTAVETTYREEDKFTTALNSTEYSFSFQVAIDHYPGKATDMNSKRPDNKSGVLTFHLEATKSKGETAGKKTKETPKEEKKTDDNHKSKKRKTTSDRETKLAKAKEMREEVLTKHKLLDSFTKADTIIHEKKFPITATQFFEQLGRWFSACVSNRAAKLEKQRNRNSLYQ
jgi:hypothetical protein